MVQSIEGELLAPSGHYAVVVSRFNELVTGRLRDGAVDTLRRHGVTEERITVVHVPGSFEIPLVAQALARSGKYVAVCCLGAVIEGETSHNQYINQQVAGGIMRASLETGIPITFGVLTCQTLEQAMNRAGGKVGNKGAEAALAAIELVSTLKKLAGAGP